MPAYLIMDIAWHDPERAATYRQRLGPTLEKHGGRTLVANEARVLEGDWSPQRVVVIEFPSMDALGAWFDSPEYAPLSQIRREGAKSRMIAVERPRTP
jgi:uncharacterized protein (DUF1330 family)